MKLPKPAKAGGTNEPRRPGRPSNSGDTAPQLDAAIGREWQKGFKSGKYENKADLAENPPDRLKSKSPVGQTVNAVYIKGAIERDRKRHPRKTRGQGL
jgi:hypothetical protein